MSTTEAAKIADMESRKGRPSLFRDEYCEQVEKLCKLGATDSDIAEFFNVTEATINNWKSKQPDFFESIRAGKILADIKVANALFDGAMDRVVIEQQAFKVKIGPHEEKVEIVEVEKVIPADFRNQQFWLKNRKSDEWRDSKDITTKGKELPAASAPIVFISADTLTDEQIEKYMKANAGPDNESL